jgi:choline dehydrogenase-like flavoprotein
MSGGQFDAIVVGSGAGGAAVAYRLVSAGRRVLLVEKGGRLPQDGSTLDPEQVLDQGTFRSREPWVNGRGRMVVPEEYFNVGGKTRWYGAALLRFAEHEFRADDRHQCPSWPIDYRDLEPYYDEAERLLGVRHFDCEPDLRKIVARFTCSGGSWRALPLPMGLAGNILDHPAEAAHFDGFASARRLKGDAESGLLDRIAQSPDYFLVTGQAVTALLPAASPQRIGGIILADGQRFFAPVTILAAGALHSPRLLQRYLATQGLAGSLPVAAQVGRNLKLHLLTAMIAISPSRKHDLLRKTTALLNDDLPHSSVQPLGFDGDMIARLIPRPAPRAVARAIGNRAYGFFLQTEDGSHRDNRVAESLTGAAGTAPCIDYDARRLVPALREHRRLVWSMHRQLLSAGFISFSRRIGIQGTAHACGTLAAGTDPARSVVDADGCVHGLSGLYVADGSVLTRSSRVNPSLTIYAWALRLADRLLRSGA